MEFPIHTKKIGYQTEASKTSEKPKKKKKKSLKQNCFQISKAKKKKIIP